MSVNIALVRFIYPPPLLGRGIGHTALIVAVASAAGPSLPAVVLSLAPWPWLFLINVPLGLEALAVGAAILPQTPRSRGRFDWWSALLSGLTLGLLVTGIDGLRGQHGVGPGLLALAGAVGVGVVFVRRQLTLAAPLLPVDLLRLPVFALSMVTSICSFGSPRSPSLVLANEAVASVPDLIVTNGAPSTLAVLAETRTGAAAPRSGPKSFRAHEPTLIR